MDEALWLTSNDVMPMLQLIRCNASERKLRLFAVAIARLLWNKMTSEGQEAVEVGEQLADGNVSEIDRLQVIEKLYTAHIRSPNDPLLRSSPAHLAAILTVGRFYPDEDLTSISWREVRKATFMFQPLLLREIFCNPYRIPSIGSALLCPSIISQAQRIYDEKVFSQLPDFADALSKSGCDESILAHCRSESPHVRGCWVLDMILGKQ